MSGAGWGLRLPERSHRREILDGPPVPREALERSLAEMDRVNRRLGGVRSVLGPVRRAAEAAGGALTLLDLGTGGGGLPRELARRLGRLGHALTWTGVDLRTEVLEVAACREQALDEGGTLVRADALALPFPDEAFDVVTSTLMLHHLSDSEAGGLLAEAARVARRLVVISDLERHPLHLLGARALAATVWRRDAITRADGPLSVLRSFTRGEFEGLAEAAPFRRMRVSRVFPFRLVLEGSPR